MLVHFYMPVNRQGVNFYVGQNRFKTSIYINKRVRPKTVGTATPPKRVDVEKWLIQFWNPLLMAVSVGYVPFPEFFSTGNNSNYCSISGVFSVLGAPRKVIDTVLESSTHGDQS